MSENLLNNETSSAGYPFDRMETATEIVFGGRISGTLASATDEAWYRFTTTDTNAHLFGNMGTYEVNMFESSLMNLYFYDADGTLLEASENYQIPYYALDLAFNRTYYLCVKPHYAGGATYALDICTVNQHSLLQSKFSSAENLDISFYGTEVSGSMEAPFGPAWYKFYTTGFQNHNNNEPNEYYITAVGEQESITVLYDSDKKEIARHYNDGTAAGSRLTVALDANKYYYICIKAPGNIFAVFDLSVEYYIQPYPGTCREAAIKLTNGQNYNEEFFSYNEDRWFKFTATEHDGNIGGYTLSGIMSCDFTATLFDSDGNEIQPVHVAVNQRDFCYWCTMSTNETYYLRVTSMSENGGSFYVNASETPSILNKGSSMADAITMYNIYTPVEGAITTPGEEKWYKLTVDGHYDKIIIHSIGENLRAVGELYDIGGNLLIPAEDFIPSEQLREPPYNFYMSRTVLAGETYYVRVTARNNGIGSFEIRWTDETFIESISFEKAYFELPEGDYATVVPILEPEDTTDTWIEWSSSDESVATVSQNGEVRAKSAGTATITATVGTYPPICASVFVKVYTPTERVLMPEEVALDIGQTYTFATVPEDATSENISWEIDDPDGVIDFNPVTRTVTALKAGIADITARPEHGMESGCRIIVAPYLFCALIENELINADNIVFTNDNFYAVTLPLSTVFARANINYLYNSIDGPEKTDVSLYYDDWYLFVIKNNTVEKCGLFKMREQENDGYDGDDPGVTISFISLPTSSLLNLLSSNTQSNSYTLLQDLNKVTGPGIYEHDADIVNYFAKTESKGAYLIAEQYVNFIAKQHSNGVIPLPSKYLSVLEEIALIDSQITNPLMDSATILTLLERKNTLSRIPNWLEQNNLNAGYNIYDPSNSNIIINNQISLNMHEKLAILATHTANVSFNSFAAEVEFHADAVNDWKSDVPIAGNIWYEAAIRADMAIGEDAESGNYDKYYDLEGELVKAQAQIHGEY